MTVHQLVFLSMWIAACSYASLRGGAPERCAAGAMFAAVIATWLCAVFRPMPTSRFNSVEIGIALTDLTLLAAIVVIALISTRFWPILLASMIGCELLGHLAKPLGPDILPRAYYMTVAFWSYPSVILLGVATWRHRVRLRRYGVDYAWVWNLPRRYRDGWSVNELAPPSPQS